MSRQYDSFMDELEQLMNKYNVAIFPSLYDSIQIWDIDYFYQSKDKEIKESLTNFKDRTEANEN